MNPTDKSVLAPERAIANPARTVIGPATERRKRWITAAVLGAFALTVVAIIAVYIGKKGRAEGKPPASVDLPSNVDQQASGFTFTRSMGGRQVFKIQAARTQALSAGGASVLQQVYVEIYGKSGTRHDTLRTERAEYSSRSGDFTSPGKVEIELNARPGLLPGTNLRGQQPVYLETSGLHFNQAESLAETDAPVRFRIGPASGSAVGMTYATREGWLELKKDVAMELRSEAGAGDSGLGIRKEEGAPARVSSANPEPRSPKPVSAANPRTPNPDLQSSASRKDLATVTRVTAGRLLYKKDPANVTLDGPVELSQSGWKLSGNSGAVLLDNQNRPTQAILEQDVHFASDFTSGLLKGKTPRLVADLDPATTAIRHLVAENGVEAESVPRATPSQPSDFEARQLDIDLSGGRNPVPVKADATGDVKFILKSVSGKAGSEQKAVGSRQKAESSRQMAVGSQRQAEASPSPVQTETLTAAEMIFTFRHDGRSLKDAQTVGSGNIVLNTDDPARGDQLITAGQFLMTFNNQSRLETLDGIGGTHIVYTPGPAPMIAHSRSQAPAKSARPTPPPAVEESFSDRLAAVFDPASGDLSSLEQTGDFRYSNGERQSAADQARYDSRSQVLTLTGSPRLWDAATRTTADRIQWHLDTETGEGLGRVRSTHFEAPASVGDPPAVDRDRSLGAEKQAKPALSEAKVRSRSREPVATNVLADQVIVTRRSQLVHYQGHVRAWHDHDVIESASLDYDGVTRRLSSGNQVLTSHLAPAMTSASPAPPLAPGASKGGTPAKTSPVAIRADSLTYFDADQKASYQGHVELRTEQTTLTADKMDVYFTRTKGKGFSGDEGSEVDHVVADDHVTVVEPGRRATGNHCEYLAAPGKVTLTGGPPTVYDEQKGLTTGKMLTFFLHDDSVYVDGGDQSPTLTKHRMSH